ncbi:MAG TPA: hypothetical protein VIJ93_03095, partial [bacterium]
MREQKLNKNIEKRSSWVLKTWLMAFVLAGVWLQTPSAHAQCTASSAILCVAGDDDTYVWINGFPITTDQPSAGGTLFPYVNWDQP